MFDSFRKPSPAVATKPAPTPPGDALASVTAMVDLGAKFRTGWCPHSAAAIWTYDAPREHAAECGRLAATIDYGSLVVAIHMVPGAIKPGPPPPPPR